MAKAKAGSACGIYSASQVDQDSEADDYESEDYQRALTALQVAVLKNRVLARALADLRTSQTARQNSAASKVRKA